MKSKYLSVSVVMATYNGQRYLKEQIDSVLSELQPGDEFIVVDDASTDGTAAILGSVAWPTLRIVKNQRNIGVLQTFERGLTLASGDLIFLCDQDDVWSPGKRASFVNAFLADERVLVVVSDAQLMDASGAMLAPSFMATRGGFKGGVLNTILRNRYLGCAMALRREVLSVALPIPRFVPMHDMWLGAVASACGHVHYIGSPLLRYRRHGGNVSPSSRQGWLRMLRWRCQLVWALILRFWRMKTLRGKVLVKLNEDRLK
jgi:glycosyltransferase involved in cell wall biosynthesis